MSNKNILAYIEIVSLQTFILNAKAKRIILIKTETAPTLGLCISHSV